MAVEREWTPAQKSAINSRRGDLLVSAAAGSGKTAVLCERIIRSLLDDGLKVSEMLVVTYMEAAAKELKEKIAKAIREQMIKTPNRSELSEQLMLLPSAEIGTIHGFCNRVISKNTAALGLPSSVHVIDAVESKVLASRVMEKIIERSCTDPAFIELSENMGSGNVSGLAKELLGLRVEAQNSLRSIEIIKDFADEYRRLDEKSWRDGKYANILLKKAKEDLSRILNNYDAAMSEAKSAKKIETLSKLCACVERLLESTSDWDAFVCAARSSEYASCLLLANQTEKKELTDITNFAMPFSSVKKLADINARILDTLYITLSEFEKAFAEEKRRIGAVDFADLERMAYKLLVDEKGNPTETAREISKKYKQIYIDEYQDTNAVQDAIFKAISSGNRFMVGDIKQSIYGFRGSEPMIFAGYRDSFPDYNENDLSDSPHRIFLSNNFRCDRPIIDFSNGIFEKLFNNNSGKIAYLKEDELKFTKDKVEKEHYDKVRILLAEKDPERKSYAEAMTVCHEIKNLLAHGVAPTDIAVLMRSPSKNIHVFKEVFEKEGVPVDGSSIKSIFDVPEVLFVLSLLNCIDNPHRDVWFASALSANIFDITFNDLIEIASSDKDRGRSLYDKFRCYTEQNGFEKGKRLLGWLDVAREKARGQSAYDTLCDVCRDFAVYALCSMNGSDGEKISSCVDSLKDLALRYEKNTYRGLGSFLALVEDVRSGKAGDGIEPEVEEKKKGVQFTSVHSSKGLEFEYCFVSCCEKEKNTQDARESVVFLSTFGAAVMPKDKGGRVKYSFPIYDAIKERIYEDSIDEEMRLLYVALTRARKRLYVTAEPKSVEKTLEKASEMRKLCSPRVFKKDTPYILWILSTFDDESSEVTVERSWVPPYRRWKTDGANDVRISGVSEGLEDVLVGPSDNEDVIQGETVLPIELEKIRERLEYAYPYDYEQSLPSKLAVSKLFPSVLDTDAIDLVKSELEFRDIPRFISESGKEEITGAMRGTATHVFMQFCDFENAEKQGVEAELARLVDKSFIDKTTADLVYIDKLKRFFASELYLEIKSAKKVWREKRFNIMLDASEFTEREELKSELSDTKLLVQGVFDCMIELSDGTLKLIDYKTDALSGDLAADEQMFKDRYTTQLSYYKRACEMMMGREIKEATVYSFGLGKEVKII
ncbi:MAG: hypothetical protein E7626_05895 [Ruminococcaceae bacterium]|nr:hypothetical protein [Oscillospiraceae bacterium]